MLSFYSGNRKLVQLHSGEFAKLYYLYVILRSYLLATGCLVTLIYQLTYPTSTLTAYMDQTDKLLLSLKSWPTSDPAAVSVAALIPRIQLERGSFRDTTEELLKKEIAAQADTSSGKPEEINLVEVEDLTSEAQNGVDKPIDDKERLEILARGREEIITEIQWVVEHFPLFQINLSYYTYRMAQHEATVALDFLSLIASLHNPEMAYSTLTPGLKEVIPIKAMGVEKVTTKYPPQVIQEDRLISQGWKMEGLNSAGDAMLKAASRLQTESEKEKRYWEQIMSIRDEGWTICKHPTQRNTLGVRYGFAESRILFSAQKGDELLILRIYKAATNFENKGFGALRRGEDGGIDMEDPNASWARKGVRVRIVDHGIITGQARPSVHQAQNPTLQDKIQIARDFIYEEELFFEILKEARHMASQGITTSEDTVSIDMKAGRSIHIDMVCLYF